MNGSTLLQTYFFHVKSKRRRGGMWIPNRNVLLLTTLLRAFAVHQNWSEKWLALHYSHIFLKFENDHPRIQCKRFKLLPLYSLLVMHTSWLFRLFKNTEYIFVVCTDCSGSCIKYPKVASVRLKSFCLYWCLTEDYHQKNTFLYRPCKLRS